MKRIRSWFSSLSYAIATILLLHTAAASGLAQNSAAPGSAPGWLPPAPVDIGGNLTPAQRQTVIARLDAIKNLLLQVPELAQPNGFEVRAKYLGGGRMWGPNREARNGNVVDYILE